MTFSGNFMPKRFGVGTSSSFKPKMETCAVCGHETSRHNIVLDFTRKVAGAVCGHCRNPLGEKK